jgi:hypothetical protein
MEQAREVLKKLNVFASNAGTRRRQHIRDQEFPAVSR